MYLHDVLKCSVECSVSAMKGVKYIPYFLFIVPLYLERFSHKFILNEVEVTSVASAGLLINNLALTIIFIIH